ncbi:Crp/Fnr family transcriptional regulator [Cellulosimicrobium sp. SH8]|uniref:Crp/Fnr family transcriptional regulator n=1 Tax=Cellulosimicrobium sp. SH8 TaxID=2952936 RepID=UPI0021F289E9|nr:Crp/Fnr family transcriptional regulator [Cellulosimicrobium sp. SH8]
MAENTGPSTRGDLCVRVVPVFQGLTPEQQLGVAAVARPTTVRPGDRPFAHVATSLLLVVHAGRFKVARSDAEGREQVLRVLGPGDFLGESGFLTGRRSEHVVTALEPGRLCVFRHADLGELVRRHPSIAFRMLQAVSARLDDVEQRLASVVSGGVGARLAEYLLSLPARGTRSGTTTGAAPETVVRLPLAKKDVASLLGTTPESLSRQLRRLHDSGVIAQRAGGEIVVLDADVLMDLAARS